MRLLAIIFIVAAAPACRLKKCMLGRTDEKLGDELLRRGATILRDIDAYLGLPKLRGAPLSLPAARAVLDAQAKDTLSRKCRDGTGTWNASLPGCPAERSIQLFRTHESVPLDTLLGGVAGGRVRVDRALAGHPLLRALWGCFKPPRCAADGVLRPTRAACPPGVEL